MGGRLDVQPRAQPERAASEALKAHGRGAPECLRAVIRREIGIRVAHLFQVRRPGPGVELVEERVVARIGFRLHDPARRITKIAELDGRGGARLLAGGLDVAVTKRAPCQLRVDLPAVDPLRAVRALLHDAARANRDVRVHRELEDVGRVLGVVEEIEMADLVGTVVRAVAGADAPVVDHHVEALRVVHGRGNRADLLARGVLALHAGNRLNDHLRAAGRIAGEVSIDADPVHLAPLRDLDLADDRDVVLALAGDHARVAPDARVEVDGHAPLVPLLVGVLLPEREVGRFLFEDTVRCEGLVRALGSSPTRLRRPTRTMTRAAPPPSTRAPTAVPPCCRAPASPTADTCAQVS